MSRTPIDRTARRMTADEAATVRRLAELTGLPLRRILRLINRTPLAWIRFQVAVELATGQWDWLDRTGRWRPDPDRQREKLRRYAAGLSEEEPCNGTSPSS